MEQNKNSHQLSPIIEPAGRTKFQAGKNSKRNIFRAVSEFWRHYSYNRLAAISLVAVFCFVIIALIAPIIAPYGPTQTRTGEPFEPPNLEHIMGTDDLGRDIYSGVLYGIRISVFVGLLAAITSSIVGVLVGATSGYFSGFVDDLLMRMTEWLIIIPRLVLAIIAVAIFGNNRLFVIIIIGLTGWTYIARIVRSEFKKLREAQFVEAAKSLGTSDLTIVFYEILPNTIFLVLVATSLQVPAAILTEAALSFVGLGDPDPRSLGLILNDAFPFLRRAWWLAVIPGLVLSAIALSFNLAGDGLNDYFNPQLKERGKESE